MRDEGNSTLVAWGFIAVGGLITAYLCFGVLQSQAKGNVNGYTLSGAVVGAVVSWGVLLSIYLQLQNSGNGVRDLRRENEDLKHKLIRGAPRPQGFDIEVDERQRIVLARPKDWEPKGGVIFQLELADEKKMPGDHFAAAFRCYFVPIEKDPNQTKDWFHKRMNKWYEDLVKWGYVQSYSQEVTRVGGDAAGVESLKFIARQIARVETHQDPSKLRAERSWYPVPWTEFVGWISSFEPRFISTGFPVTINLSGTGFHNGAECYVNTKKRKLTVRTPLLAEVTLEAEDVARPGNLEIHVQNPEADNKPSNSVWVVVAGAAQPWYSPVGPVIGGDLKEVQPEPAPQVDTQKPVEEAQPTANTDKATDTGKIADSTGDPKPEVVTVVYLEIVSMTVISYHEELEKIYYFEFWDDAKDFLKSSDEFNRILASTRFLS